MTTLETNKETAQRIFERIFNEPYNDEERAMKEIVEALSAKDSTISKLEGKVERLTSFGWIALKMNIRVAIDNEASKVIIAELKDELDSIREFIKGASLHPHITGVSILDDVKDIMREASDLTTKLNQSLFREVAVRAALLKCRVALTPHVFIDNDARKARDLADNTLSNPSPDITEIEERLRAAKKDNLSGFYEWQIEKHSAEYEIEFRGNEIKSLQSQLKVAVASLEKISRKQYGEEYGGITPAVIATKALSTLSQSGKELE